MPEFHRAGRKRINVFEGEETYVFRHYVEDELFQELQPFYTDGRFEVPKDRFDKVEDLLTDNSYDPVVVEDVEQYCVVKRRYTEHPDILFEESVLETGTADHTVFVMKDLDAVEAALGKGATRITDTDVVSEF